MNRPVRNSWAAVVGLLIGMVLGALLLGCSALESPAQAALPGKVAGAFYYETMTVDGTTRCVVVMPRSRAGVSISCDWKPEAPGTKPKTQNSPYPLEPDQQPGRVVTR